MVSEGLKSHRRKQAPPFLHPAVVSPRDRAGSHQVRAGGQTAASAHAASAHVFFPLMVESELLL